MCSRDVIFVLSSIFVSCSHFSVGNENSAIADGVSDPWPKLLSELNEPDSASHAFFPQMCDVGLDLLALTRRDAEESEAKFDRGQTANGEEQKRRRNQFLASEAAFKNRQSLAWVESQISPVTYAQLKTIQDQARTFDAGRLTEIAKDPLQFEIGFCFGRALLVHDLLLRNNIPRKYLAKIFVVGDLFVSGSFWDYHVAVLVATDHGPMVMDLIQPNPIPLSDWVTANQRLDIKWPLSQARFYITDVRKFMPASGIYDEGAIKNPLYQEFFQRLGKELAFLR